MAMTKAERRELETARMRAEKAEKLLADFLGKHETDTSSNPTPGFRLIKSTVATGMVERPLRARSSIIFKPDARFPFDKIDCRLKDGGVYINGTRKIIIVPQASNAVHVYLEPVDKEA